MTTVENLLPAGVFDTIIENADSHLLLLNKEFSIVSMNAGVYWVFLELYDIHLKKGESLFDLMRTTAPSVADRWQIRCQAALKGLSISDEEEHFESQGSKLTWKIYYKSVRIADEQFISIYLRNISAAKLAYNQLLKRESNVRTMLNALTTKVWLLNAQLEIVDFNENSFDYFSHTYNVTLLPGRKFLELLPEGMTDLRLKWLERLNAVLVEKQITSHVDTKLINGQEVINEIHIIPVVANDELTGITVSIEDVTRNRVEEDRQRAHFQQMQRLGSEIDKFLYGVSHDLRAPLLSIVGVTSVMKRDSPKDFALLNHIETTVKKLDNFVTNVIAYSREHKLAVSTDEIDFDKLISSVLDSLTYLEKSRFVKCTRVIRQDVPFYSDRNRVASILRNIFANAFQYLDLSSNPAVKISVHVTHEGASIELQDEEPNSTHVFESFFQGVDTSTGSGLGYYIVKNTIEKLEGQILIKSNEGLGSGVIVIIPNQLQSIKS